MRPELIVIGQVARPHGLGGGLRVRPLTDQPQVRFDGLSQCVIWESGADERAVHAVTSCRFDGETALLQLEGVDSIGSAARLVGRLVAVEGEALPPPPGHFYPWQLTDARVVTRDGVIVGHFVGIEPTVGQDLWVIAAGDRQWLLPAVPEIVLDVDISAGRIIIDPPEGLVDL
jgi:16S rRNA processing protein RimM